MEKRRDTKRAGDGSYLGRVGEQVRLPRLAGAVYRGTRWSGRTEGKRTRIE